MTLIAVLAIAAAAAWYVHGGQRRTGAGASADAWARQLRTPLVRLATMLGISTRNGRKANRAAQGAVGERKTARLLQELRREGWTLLHDRALPSSRANVDHIIVSPRGLVCVIDSKLWFGQTLRRVEGRLLQGRHDVTGRLKGLRFETRTVARLLDDAKVIPVVIMHEAPVEGGSFALDGIRIVSADRACAFLRKIDRCLVIPTPRADIAARADQLLPPYRHGRN